MATTAKVSDVPPTMVKIAEKAVKKLFKKDIVAETLEEPERLEAATKLEIYKLNQNHLIELVYKRTEGCDRKCLYWDGDHLMTPVKQPYYHGTKGHVRAGYYQGMFDLDQAIYRLFNSDRRIAKYPSKEISHYCGQQQCMTHLRLEDKGISKERESCVKGCPHKPKCIVWIPSEHIVVPEPCFKAKGKDSYYCHSSLWVY